MEYETFIYRILTAKNSLAHVAKEDPVLMTIYKDLELYLKENCLHEYVADYADTDPERSEPITYCRYCMMEKAEVKYNNFMGDGDDCAGASRDGSMGRKCLGGGGGGRTRPKCKK